MQMNPMVKISVEGTMIANGNKDNRIVFTKTGFNNTEVKQIRARLVAGLEVAQGFLQLYDGRQWRHVCSQNREWTNIDVRVTCNGMGFQQGIFSLSSMAENDTSHILLTNPLCNGTESSISDCIGMRTSSIGSSECNLQSLVGLHCWGALNTSFPDYWWGLTFYNSTVKENIYNPQNTRLNVSRSQLSYVDILYAGVNWTQQRVSALSASPYPPVISHMLFSNNAYDALNFTDIRGPAEIHHTKFENNSGHGFNITSSVGYVELVNVSSRHNQGAGGYIQITSNHWTEETPELLDMAKTICGEGVITSSPIFPFLVLTQHQVPTYKMEALCELPITTDKPYQIISVKLVEAVRDPGASAIITITDVSTSKILAKWNFTDSNSQSKHSPTDPLLYGPLYQGVSSTSPSIKISYEWKKDPTQEYCPYLRQCFRGILQISVGGTTNPEVVIRDSVFEKNVQHGLRIENLGIYAQVFNSKFISNEYWAGLSVVNGSADILVHNCKFSDNDRAGLNITMAGGTRVVNSSQFINNNGYGLDIWNPTWLMTRLPNVPIENVVFLSNFQNNSFSGIRFYNSSFPMNILVNFSSFIDNKKNGIEMVAAIINQNKLLTNFSVGFSTFTNNHWHGIYISPIGQMTGKIVNTTCNNHRNGGCIYIDNGMNFDEQRLIYRHLFVEYFIAYNDFFNNSGPFVVAVRLTQGSDFQNCKIVLNKFFDNKIGLFKNQLNPRNTAPAVILLGSSNIIFSRNLIRNSQSVYDIATQMSVANGFIDATKNFWGSRTDFGGLTWEKIHEKVFHRLFDHESRYSLAKIVYFPLIQESNLHSKILSDKDPPYQHKFRNGSSLIIGGVIDVNVEQNIKLEYNSSPYIVTKDIFVPQGATLTVSEGVKLHFDNSVGLFVQGKVVLVGSQIRPINMHMSKLNLSTSFGSSIQLLSKDQIENSLNNLTNVNSSLVLDNIGAVTGIVRVLLHGSWGVICDNRLELVTVRIICAELGLVAHSMDWKLPQKDKLSNAFNDTILMSSVRCQIWNTRLDQCEYDGVNEHQCVTGIVNVRCYKPGWAGIKISLTNEVSELSRLNISQAGLFDYYESQFRPSLQIDYHKHILHNVHISNSLSDGLLIQLNDLLSFNNISNLHMADNLGSGAVTKSPWIVFDQSTFVNNKLSGLKFDPGFSEESLFDLRASMLKTLNLTSDPINVYKLGIHTEGIEVLSTYIGSSVEQTEYWTELRTTDPNNQHQLLINIIDFNPDSKVENVTFFDNSYENVKNQLSNLNAGSSISWSIPNDLTRFPILSNRQFVTIRIAVNGVRSGRLALIVQSRSFIDLWNTGQLSKDTTTANGLMYYPPTAFVVSNCLLANNSVGLSITHFNSGTDSQNCSYTTRTSRLNVTVTNNTFRNNSILAFHIPSVSPFINDIYFPTYGDDVTMESSSRISRIFYNISYCTFINNGAILLAEHNHVPFSSNVWQYNTLNNLFISNRGPLTISLPFVSQRFDWRYLPDMFHSIHLNINTFVDNRDYQLIIDGYYTKLRIGHNNFTNNECLKQGLLSLRGMEKAFNISHNFVKYNGDCQYLFEVTSDSQTDGALTVMGYIGYNILHNNTCNPQMGAAISCYSIGIFGNQNVTVTRNILSNGDKFKYELVAGLKSSGMFDARENFWGTIIIDKIHYLIFDVNNWNNFVEVDFSRFLLKPDIFTTEIYTGLIPAISQDLNNNFGGKISSNLFLMSRFEPYIVKSDITVMKGVELRIDAGVILEFMPNVGILVYGRLIARGTVYRPIVMRPWQAPQTMKRRKRSLVPVQNKIRMVVGNSSNEGFVKFFNDTAQRWDYLCDDQFSREVARVVCREMGQPSFNPKIRRTHLLDFRLYGYDNPFVTKYIWNDRYVCRGYETSTSSCIRRLNYNSFECLIKRQFVFLRCGLDFLNPDESYWGNIRIVLKSLEQRNISLESERSYLEYVNISKAGMLHEELVSAIQSTYAAPFLKYVSVSKCAWNGVDLIAPTIYTQITNSSFTDNAGYGAAITVLNGDSTDPLTTNKGTFPMLLSPLPSSILSLLDMCDINKQIPITDRILIYYRYSYSTIACTKLVHSVIPNRQIAVRFLQLNLYYDPFTRNSIELFNGFDFNITEQLASISAVPLEDLEYNGFLTTRSLPSYVNTIGYDSIGIHLFASSASEIHGFIMELITLPISPDNTYIDRTGSPPHKIAESEFTRNEAGCIRISSVGESYPFYDIFYNRFIDNGGLPLLNLTADPVLLVRMENCRDINIANNYIYHNRGGTEMHLYPCSNKRGIRANFTNNVIVRNTHARALTMIGNYMSTAQVYRNFFSNNDCEYRDLIKIQGLIVKPFSYNFISRNRASVMINASGAENLSPMSEYLWNGFYENWSINFTRSTTVYCDNSKNIFTNNYFRNLRNDFELVVGNRSIMKEYPMEPGKGCPLKSICLSGWTVMLERNSCICYRPDKLDARQNWWGEDSLFYIKNKIWDQTDNKYLIEIDYSRFYTNNKSVLFDSMYCPPTWEYHKSNCFFYFGAALNYTEANDFCHTEVDSVLANSRDKIEWLGALMASWQNNFWWLNKDTWNTRSWVHSYLPLVDLCPSVKSTWLEGFPCDRKIQFFCQKSPNGVYLGVQIDFIVAIVVLFIILVIIILLFIILWNRKSRMRAQAFLVRCEFLKLRFVDPSEFEPHYPASIADAVDRGSISHLYNKNPPFAVETMKSSVSSSGLSRYDEDVMRMRRNIIDDNKESIRRPKSSSQITYSTPRPVEVVTAMPMIDSKKGRYSSRARPVTSKTATLNSMQSSTSMEALYLKLEPNSQLRLSQPDVPQIMEKSKSRSALHLAAGDATDDPSRMTSMVDDLLDPSVRSRNRPVMIRSTSGLRSASITDSFPSNKPSLNNEDHTQLLKPLPQKTHKKHHGHSSKSRGKDRLLSSESEI